MGGENQQAFVEDQRSGERCKASEKADSQGGGFTVVQIFHGQYDLRGRLYGKGPFYRRIRRSFERKMCHGRYKISRTLDGGLGKKAPSGGKRRLDKSKSRKRGDHPLAKRERITLLVHWVRAIGQVK